MMQRMINTYISGMDQDSSVNKFNPKNYFEAWNLSPLSIDGLSNAAMNNVKGNSPFYNCPYYVIGHCVIRNYVVLFMTSCTDTVGGTGYIYKMDTDTNIITQVKIGAFKFSTQYPIFNETAGYYERSDVIKVYWTDNFNCLRFINIMDPPVDIKECDIVQDVSFGSAGRIYLESTAGGNLLSGRVQYSYQCYNVNGGQSIFSPASPLYNIAGSSYNATNDEDFKGSSNLDDVGVRVNAGKSFVLRIIGADTSFDRVRVVAIHYNVIDTVPEIRVIGNYPVSTSIKFIDDGRADYGTITLEEYRTLGGDVFTAKSISVKDNILFAANIKNKYFDCDFDARTYRFNKTYVCKVYDRYGVLHTITKSVGTWPTPVYTMGGSPVAETHDCICPLNYNVASNIVEELSTESGRDGYKYQSNGTTLGGEGPNVKYNFTIKDINIRSYNVYANKNYVSGYVGLVDPRLSGEYCGYKRDEIYRFGLVLFNAKGQQSFVKWIGDIRMPTASDFYPIAYKEGATGDTRANILGVEFYIDKASLPADVVSFEIVRVHRTQSDKTIMCSGIISQTDKATMGGVADCYHPVLFPKYKTYSWGLYTPRYEIINLISPEVSFYKNQNYSSGDYLKTAGRIEERHHTNYSEGFTDTYMLHGVEPNPIEFSGSHYGATALCYRQVAALTYLDVAPVIDFKILGYVDKANISANIETFPSYKYVHFGKIRPGSSVTEAPIGTSLVAEMSVTPISLSHIGGDDNLETYYVDYKKNNVLSIYGGLNYDDRIQNTYIPCCTHYWLGNVVNRILKSAYSNEAIYTYGGDTYINSFKHLRAIFSGADIDMDGTPEIDKNNRYEVTVTFPVESTINIVYANGENIDDGTVAEHLGMQDQAGDHPIRTSIEPLSGITALSYDQEEDMYLYNSVYSQPNSGREFYSEPVSWVAISENDTRIKNSNTKIANEEIDSWLQFLTDNIIDVDSSFGPINKILRFKNHMLFFQDRGVGTLSVNERQLVPVENNAALELGTGGVLDRFDMIATGVGCQHREAIIATDLGFYWLDWKKRALYRYNQTAEDITSVKGMMSYMNNIVDEFTGNENPLYGGGILLIKNPMFKDIWVTFFGSTYKRSLVYNEMMDAFTFFHRSVPCYSINVDNKLYTSLNDLYIYQENIGDFGYFFGTAYPSTITLIVNPHSNIVSAFHNFEFTTEVWDGVTDVYNETLNHLRVYNNYQDTGIITMTPGTNIRRRLRTWRCNVPRDGSTTRIRDSFIKVFISRTNDLTNKRFVLHDIHTLYDIPAETLITKQ